MRGNSYHNTTESHGADLKRYRQQAGSQEATILVAFRDCFPYSSPSEVCAVVFSNSIPITSVRRALTNLTDAGDLVKTNTQVKGPYGRPEFVWRIADKHKQQEMF